MLLVLGVLVRHEALEEEEECLFSKLTALVCVNRFFLLIVLILELVHGLVHLRDGVVGLVHYHLGGG